MYDNNYLASRLIRTGSKRLKKDLILQPELDRRTSYVDFITNSEKSAQLLVDLGVKPGDTVLVYAPKSATSIELYFGCLLSGAVYTPINPAIPSEEVPYFVEDARPSLIICDESRYEDCFSNQRNTTPVLTINANETGSFIDQRSNYAAGFISVNRQAKDPAAILYTSGTTGRPKGVIHSHAALFSNAEVLVHSWSFHESDTLIHALPIFHLHGLFTAVNVVLASGASCIYLSNFDRNAVLAVMPQSTVMMGIPPYYTSLLEDPRLSDASKNMRAFISGSAPMLPQTHMDWYSKTGNMIIERYGMTECSMIASNPYEGLRKPNTVGFPLKGTKVRITDLKSGEPLTNGEIGMIEIQGPSLFDGYLNKPEKTSEDMREDGFFISGDLGRYDDEGYLMVLGRVKDAIFTEDGIIIPKEVEEQIDAIPGVSESAVISVPHPIKKNVPVAIIVGRNIDTDEIGKAMCSKIEPFKCPVKYIHVDALPRNTMGKVQKTALRETYSGLFDNDLVA